jgi:hypothetical protein
MAISEQHMPTFLKRNATMEESTSRYLEWILLAVVASKNDGILGLRLIEVGNDEDVVHLLIAPDCRRHILGEDLQLPELKNGARNKVREEPGHFLPVLASLLERTEWWGEEVGPRIRAEYFKQRGELADGPATRAVTPEELSEIAAIKGHTPHPAAPGSIGLAVVTRPIGNRELKQAVMGWLKDRGFAEITEAMVGIGKVGQNAQKLIEITLPRKNPSAPLVRRLKIELDRAGIPADPINLSNALAFRFGSSFAEKIDA